MKGFVGHRTSPEISPHKDASVATATAPPAWSQASRGGIWEAPCPYQDGGGHRQGAGLSAVGLSRRFLCFRFLMLTASFRQYLFYFLVWEPREPGREGWSTGIGVNTPGAKAGLPCLAGSDATVAAADRWNGRWVQVPAWPRLDWGTDASGERQRQPPRAYRPLGRALGSDPTTLAWRPPLYLVRITYPTTGDSLHGPEGRGGEGPDLQGWG